ncbi:hypothetical protein [Parasediminibacterium sp. JCM 36343]|uniref:hypothetical protein n=1 Tax=Parasediminibacterium sp. JCM 36343 TaxID=3374279 RepID=UPI0039784CD3
MGKNVVCMRVRVVCMHKIVPCMRKIVVCMDNPAVFWGIQGQIVCISMKRLGDVMVFLRFLKVSSLQLPESLKLSGSFLSCEATKRD